MSSQDLPREFMDFTLLEVLGRGGAGVVYRARDRALRVERAIKILHLPKYGGTHPLAGRFLREARAAAGIQHDGVVRVQRFGEHDGDAYVVMDLIDGPNLDEWLGGREVSGLIPPVQACTLVERIAEIVQAAHEHGVLHRDLKPANVLMAGDRDPRLTDFGLAKILTSSEASLTETGALVGTPAYMSPEQAAGRRREVGVPADVYALGAILYRLLTGRAPHERDTVVESYQAALAGDVTPPRRLVPNLHSNLQNICMKAMHESPDRRYASAAALAADLRRHLEGERTVARTPAPAVRAWRAVRSHPRAATLVLILLAVLVGAWSAQQRFSARFQGDWQAQTDADVPGSFAVRWNDGPAEPATAPIHLEGTGRWVVRAPSHTLESGVDRRTSLAFAGMRGVQEVGVFQDGTEGSLLPQGLYGAVRRRDDGWEAVMARSGAEVLATPISLPAGGGRHTLRLARKGFDITLSVNGDVVLELEDPFPLDGHGASYDGVFVAAEAPAALTVHALTVERMSPTELMSAMTHADGLLAAGERSAAAARYAEVADVATTPRTRLLARLRRWFALSHRDADIDTLRASAVAMTAMSTELDAPSAKALVLAHAARSHAWAGDWRACTAAIRSAHAASPDGAFLLASTVWHWHHRAQRENDWNLVVGMARAQTALEDTLHHPLFPLAPQAARAMGEAGRYDHIPEVLQPYVARADGAERVTERAILVRSLLHIGRDADGLSEAASTLPLTRDRRDLARWLVRTMLADAVRRRDAAECRGVAALVPEEHAAWADLARNVADILDGVCGTDTLRARLGTPIHPEWMATGMAAAIVLDGGPTPEDWRLLAGRGELDPTMDPASDTPVHVLAARVREGLLPAQEASAQLPSWWLAEWVTFFHAAATAPEGDAPTWKGGHLPLELQCLVADERLHPPGIEPRPR